MPRPRTRRRERRSIPQGRAYIYSTFNNTLVSLTDPDGNVVASTSSGTAGFRGSRKGTAFAAQRAAELAARRGVDMGMRNIDVYIKGPGSGREPAIRALQGAGLNVTSIRDVTPFLTTACVRQAAPGVNRTPDQPPGGFPLTRTADCHQLRPHHQRTD